MKDPETVYCSRCHQNVRYHYDPVNHWKNLLLTIGSLGLWLPIWLSVTFGPSKICDVCGDPLWNDASARPVATGRRAT